MKEPENLLHLWHGTQRTRRGEERGHGRVGLLLIEEHEVVLCGRTTETQPPPSFLLREALTSDYCITPFRRSDVYGDAFETLERCFDGRRFNLPPILEFSETLRSVARSLFIHCLVHARYNKDLLVCA